MNPAKVKAVARVRQFDAELAAVLGVPVATVARTNEHARPTRSWLAAALVLLGVLVTAAVAWQQRHADALQEPHSLEPPAMPGRVCEVSPTVHFGVWSSLPLAATVGIRPNSSLARDLSAFAPYTQLRSLMLRGAPEWSADGLKALAGMRQLEVLGLPVNENVNAAHFRTLADVPSLRFLTLQLQRPLCADDVDALAAVRGVVSLRLIGGSIDANAMRHLAALPGLRVLGLVAVGCTEDVLVELRGLRGLQRLDLRLLGDIPRPTPGEDPMDLDSYGLPRAAGRGSAGLTLRVAKALAELPALRAVTLTATECSVAAIEALPHLEHVGVLASPHLGPGVFDALARLPHLRRLDLDAADRQCRWPGQWSGDIEPAIERAMTAAGPREEVWQAQARLLAKARPTELRYCGAIPDVVREIIATLPLVAFTSKAGRKEDLAVIAELPGLRRVGLEDCVRSIDDLEPLTRVPNLLELGLRASRDFVTNITVAEVRALLPNVAVTAHGF